MCFAKLIWLDLWGLQSICLAFPEPLSLLVQLLELAYLVYEQRWFYPVLCLSLFIITGFIFARFKRASERKVMALINTVRVVPIVEGGFVRAISSHKLVPGDVVVLKSGKALCDMVLLRGTCMVVEATLSGEVYVLPGQTLASAAQPC